MATYPDLDLEDALCAIHMKRQRVGEIYSYDTDFDLLEGLDRVEP
jgi:predicted nucleic acid-binding protein